jgi:hypothetical protein
MYNLHLTNAKDWKSNWNLMLDNINLRLKKESDRHYKLLHNKINILLKKAKTNNKEEIDKYYFITLDGVVRLFKLYSVTVQDAND